MPGGSALEGPAYSQRLQAAPCRGLADESPVEQAMLRSIAEESGVWGPHDSAIVMQANSPTQR